jgi:DNA-binding response OmpR family regulator
LQVAIFVAEVFCFCYNLMRTMAEEKIKKILVAEDEKPMAHALNLKLTHAGFEVTNAYDGLECVSFLEKEKFDLILLDIMMPKMDGFSVLEKIKELGIKTSVIMLSNLSQEDDKKKTKELGAKGFFIKSNTPILEIVEKVKSLI